MSKKMGIVCAVMVLGLLVFGCTHSPKGIGQKTGVIQMANMDYWVLSADDIAFVMRQAGFADERIIEMGGELRNALATAGSAQIYISGKVEGIFSVESKFLHVTSRKRGAFMYDLERHELKY